MIQSQEHYRLRSLNEQLRIAYEKLDFYRERILVESSPATQFQMKHEAETKLLPTIGRCEVEIAEILAGQTTRELPDREASNLIVLLTQAVNELDKSIELQSDSKKRERYDEVKGALEKTLTEPGKAATAKLKLSLPIIPMLLSYELLLDTEASLVQVWRKIKAAFGARDE